MLLLKRQAQALMASQRFVLFFCGRRLLGRLSVIALRTVTAWKTLAAGLPFLKIQRHQPRPEVNNIGNHPRLIGPMDTVAELTAPTPLCFIDMNIMQVLDPIAKSG